MQALIADIYALQKMYQRMYDAQDDRAAPYDAEDEEQIDRHYAAEAYYKHCKQATLEKHKSILLQYPEPQLYLKLADPNALRIFEQLTIHLKFYG